MHTDDERDPLSHDDDLRKLFDSLPRTSALRPGEVDEAVRQLRAVGALGAPRRRITWPVAVAAAVVLFAAGIATGVAYTRHNSLEEMLARRDLTVAERVLLLQRAGSAYVRAAQSYADATSKVDSNAVEVASKVLIGAAHAVARTSLDAGLSARLSSVLQTGVTPPSPPKLKPVIWF